jgi:predicted 3-demethylubiquinone-9 3-methyltransferase (glyoxalase superfamily)
MATITTFLTYNDQAEDAVDLYTSAFGDSRITSVSRYGDGGPGTPGGVMSIQFELEGKEFIALNGGPSFNFAQGISLFASCETQQEIDRLWDKLTSGGGEPGPCGWLTDRFGVSWQIVPRVLGEMLGDPDPEKAGRAMQAMLGMSRLDIAELRRAFEGHPAAAR